LEGPFGLGRAGSKSGEDKTLGRGVKRKGNRDLCAAEPGIGTETMVQGGLPLDRVNVWPDRCNCGWGYLSPS